MNRVIRNGIAPDVASAAADWFARLQEDDSNERDLQEWQQWLNAAPEHGQAYREVEQAWRLIGEVKPLPWVSQAELRAQSASLPAARARMGMPANVSRPVVYALAAGILAAVAATVSIYLTAERADYSTRTAEQRSVRLSDGSRVTIGASSRITPVFAKSSRRVVLDFGEAFFEVSHDPERPFTVAVGASEIRAVGTAFNVRSTSDRVWVNVTEGRVAVTASKNVAHREVLLATGEQAAITNAGAVEQKAQTASAVTWLQGRFEYRGEELRNVLDDLNRYTDRRIVLTDDSLGRLRYSGTVFPDHLDEWLQGIGGALPVAVRETDKQREISPAR